MLWRVLEMQSPSAVGVVEVLGPGQCEMRSSSLSCPGELLLTLLWFVLQACNNTSDRKHADSILEKYVTEIVMSIVTTFFSSPFSDQSTTLQVGARTDTAGKTLPRQLCSFCFGAIYLCQRNARCNGGADTSLFLVTRAVL